MLKNKIETLKEENSKLKHDKREEGMLMKSLETLNEKRAKQIWQTEIRQTQKHQSRQRLVVVVSSSSQ